MTENELQQAYEELKNSYNYHDHRPQTRQGQEMLKQDEERFIDEALLPYIKQIVENFTNVLRNPITLRLTIPSNAGSIKAERITTKVQISPKNTPTFPRRDASGLKIVLPDGKIIQEQSATDSMCTAIQYAISIFGINTVLDSMEKIWLFINMCGWLRHPFFVDFRLNQTKKMGYFLKFNRQKKQKKKPMSKLYKSIFNVNGCSVVKQEQTDTTVTITVRLTKGNASRCGCCGRKGKLYDNGREQRVWRTLDLGTKMGFIRMDTYRVKCKKCGVKTVKVPWASHRSGFTDAFEQQVAWAVCSMSKKAVAKQLRIAWNTVGEIADRVWDRLDTRPIKAGCIFRRIGIDETSYKKGHKYITVVVDHDRRCVIWVHEGYGKEVLDLFMRELSEEQRKGVELVTCDGAKWIRSSIEEFLPNAERCVDSFHVVQWATEALDKVRVEAWKEARKENRNQKRGRGRPTKDSVPKDRTAEGIKNSRYALGKAPENLNESQQRKIELIASRYPRLYRAYQLKEELRIILKMGYDDARENLDRWLWRASHSRIGSVKDLYAKIKRNYDGILNTIRLGVSNARIEATNNKIKLLIRTAYGFRNMNNMLSLIMLSCSYVDVKIAYEWESESRESSSKAA